MWRTLLLLLLFCGEASAYQTELVFGAGTGGASPIPAPRDAVFAVRDADTDTVLTEWRISGITPADSGRSWTLDEPSALAAGVDWSALEDAAWRPDDYEFMSGFVHPRWTTHGYPYGRIRRLDTLTFHLAEYFTSPIGAVANWSHTLRGEGFTVPEPASILLLSVACCFVHGCRLRVRR